VSCAWLVDDVGGIETVRVIQYAARLLQLARRVPGIELAWPRDRAGISRAARSSFSRLAEWTALVDDAAAILAAKVTRRGRRRPTDQLTGDKANASRSWASIVAKDAVYLW